MSMYNVQQRTTYGKTLPSYVLMQVEMWALLGLLSLILLLPASTGPLVRPSLRPKRHRRSHQGGLGTAGAQAAGHSSAAADEEQAATLLTQPLLTQYETQPGQEKAGAAAPALRLPGQPQMVATGPGGVQGGGGGEEDSSSSVSREEGETGPGQDLSVGEWVQVGQCVEDVLLLHDIGPAPGNLQQLHHRQLHAPTHALIRWSCPCIRGQSAAA
jgi:hypothetical protein